MLILYTSYDADEGPDNELDDVEEAAPSAAIVDSTNVDWMSYAKNQAHD